jgi:hypothetical protein
MYEMKMKTNPEEHRIPPSALNGVANSYRRKDRVAQ